MVCALRGVLFAGVPGAGGHDAIFAIVLRAQDTPRVAREFQTLGGGGRVHALRVCRADEGVRCE